MDAVKFARFSEPVAKAYGAATRARVRAMRAMRTMSPPLYELHSAYRHPFSADRTGPRVPPPRTDRLLLPDAGLRGPGRGRRPGDDGACLARRRAAPGPGRAEVVALPDREQRLLRHAR